MGGEGQKVRVVDGLIPVITGHHDLHVVVQTGGGGTLQVAEGADVFADGSGEVLRFHEAHILATRVTQYVTERMHAAPAFGGERNVIGRIIHLRLQTWRRLEAPHRRFRRVRPQCTQPFPHDGVATCKTQLAQFFVQTHRRQIRVTFQQLRDLIGVRVEQTRPARRFLFGGAGAAFLVLAEDAEHALAMDAQQARDGALRSAGVMQPHNLVAGGFFHAVFSSFTRSLLSAATDPASRASFSKRGVSSRRSSAVRPLRPWCASHTSMRPNTSSSSPMRFQS